MKKFVILILMLLLVPTALAQDYTLKAGVSVNDVPKALFGSWRVNAKLDDTNSYGTFKPNSVDFWTLSRVGDKITLTNPFTGASASIRVNYVDGSTIRFTKQGDYDNKILTDTVEIKLDGERFTGINTIKLETLSDIDKSIIKTETAKYSLAGEKISGMSIMEK